MHAISRIFLKTLAVLTITLALSTHAQTSGRPSSITFLDKVYSLAWKAGEINNGIALYLPEGESLEGYTDMLRVEGSSRSSVTDQVQAQMQFLGRDTSNFGARILDLTENPNTGEVLLLFLSVIEEDGVAKWAWSAYRYMPMQTANGKQEGFRLFDHSRKYIGNDKEGIERFLEEVGTKQAERINALNHLQIP